MNDYVNELEKELNFLTETLRTDEKVFVPGDPEFTSYMEGIERLNKIVQTAIKEDALATLERKKEENKAQTEALRLELEQNKFELEKRDKELRLEFDQSMARKKLALEVRHESNRHEEELERIYNEHREHTVEVVSGSLEKVGIAGLLFGSVLLICGYEQTGVISKTALDVAGKMLRFVGMR